MPKKKIRQEKSLKNQEAEPIKEEAFVEENSSIGEENALEVIEKLNAENAELKDRLMRALAEVENIRRRTDKEKTDMARYAVSPLAKDLMPVADNLQRAMESLPEEVRETADEQIKNFITGVEMTEKMLQEAFAKNRIEYINPQGEKFDYKRHQAMTEVENSDHPAGTVVHVMQPGYVLNERLLRPAMVAVAKGTSQQKPDNVQSVDTTA